MAVASLPPFEFKELESTHEITLPNSPRGPRFYGGIRMLADRAIGSLLFVRLALQTRTACGSVDGR
jgi:hypothetical protein